MLVPGVGAWLRSVTSARMVAISNFFSSRIAFQPGGYYVPLVSCSWSGVFEFQVVVFHFWQLRHHFFLIGARTNTMTKFVYYTLVMAGHAQRYERALQQMIAMERTHDHK